MLAERAMCSRCGERPQSSGMKSSLCVDCRADSAARGQTTRRRRGVGVYAWRPREQQLVCPRCGLEVTRANASLHAWQAHHLAVPAFEVASVFRAVAR